MTKKTKTSDDILFTNLRAETIKNNNFRKVIYTDYERLQIALYSLNPREALDFETHDHKTQFIYLEQGQCVIYLQKKSYLLKAGDVFVIPPGTLHYIVNSGLNVLKMFSIYCPAEFDSGHVDVTKPL